MSSHAPAALLKNAIPSLEIKVLTYRNSDRWAAEIATWLADATPMSWKRENISEDAAIKDAYQAACEHWLHS